MKVNSKENTIIVAHRGASHYAPENTLPSFELAFKENADFIEGDFWLTKDNEIVCIHDSDTSRVTKKLFNLDVRNSTLRELKKIDIGVWKGDKFRNSYIPTLREILQIIPKDKGIFIELKDDRLLLLQNISKIINEYDFTPERIRLIAFNPKMVLSAKKILPEIKTYWLYNWYIVKETYSFSNTKQQILRALEILNCDGIDINPAPWLDIQFINDLRKHNLDFATYAVDNFQDTLKLLTLGVDYITTDSPKNIRQKIKNYFSIPTLSNKENESVVIKDGKEIKLN